MEKKGPRRAYKKGNAFKENKVVIGNESRVRSQKPKKSDPHVTVESSEFQLLVKLYVPAQLLITNNRVSLKQLRDYLPILVNESYPDLNLELHLFLSSIVTCYVLSWYLQKLNTDNTDFVVHVYEALCYFVKDFSTRILAVAELPRLLDMVNEMAAILDQHIRDNTLIDNVPRYALAYLQKSSSSVLAGTGLESLRRRYLSDSHVIFLSPSDQSNSKECQTFYRAIALEVLSATFSGDVQGPRGSKIVSNLLTVIIADLVFDKIIGILASPKFILQDVVANVFSKPDLAKTQPEKRTKLAQGSMIQILRTKMYGSWKVVTLMLQRKEISEGVKPLILHSPVLNLFDTITRFSEVRSVVSQGLSLLRASLYIKNGLAQKLEDFISKSIMTKFRTSSILHDVFLANIVEKLRTTVFDKSAKRTQAPAPELSTKELSELIYSSVFTKASNPLVGAFIHSLAYKDQGPHEAKEEIEKILSIFGMEPGSESSDMNKLLVAKLLDCVVRQLYPSLFEVMHA